MSGCRSCAALGRVLAHNRAPARVPGEAAMRIVSPVLAAAFAAMLCTAGCALDKQQELEKVAKDWCATIRASQVMPVYPLTQDIQPGDLFLVQLPIDKQQEVWKQKGSLPLDNHLGRLDPRGYKDFYAKSFPPREPAGADL